MPRWRSLVPRLAPVGPRAALRVTVAALLAGCGGGGTGPIGLYPRPLRVPDGARCYWGTGLGLNPRAARDSAWLVLGAPVKDVKENRAYTVRLGGDGEAGAWTRTKGDSLQFYLVDGFARADFQVLAESTGAEGWGRESGMRDPVDRDNPPAAWRVRLRPARCTSLPPTNDPR
jgi:hypothetical protein